MDEYNEKDYNEIENKIKQAANELPLPDENQLFEQVNQAKAERKKRERLLKSTIPSGIAAVLCIILALSLLLPKKETSRYFYTTDLVLLNQKNEEIFYSSLNKAGKQYADFSNYYFHAFNLVVTKDDCIVKGTYIGGQDKKNPDADDLECMFIIATYDLNVIDARGTNYSNLPEIHYANGTKVEYKVSSQVDDGTTTYNYFAYTVYKNMQYLIEYISLYKDGTTFFDNIFVK